MIDSIWFTRNSIVHQQAILNLYDLQSSIFRRFTAHLMAWSERFSSPPCVWNPPGPGVIKLNFDTAVTHTSLVFAVVCRNSDGEVIAARSGWKIGSYPLEDEAIDCCGEYRDIVILEGDAQVLLSLISNY